jgi:tRNA threonylcarbamoyladenosine biosynthesis protein TsaB
VLTLAFDTSSLAGSVALLDGPDVLAERTLDPSRRSAQTLAPAIALLLERHRVPARKVGLVATTNGPGSFTGLRVGVTTAKTWAYATGGAVIGLSTLAVIARQVPSELRLTANEVQTVLEAQRKELYVGRFHGTRCERLAADAIVPAEAWLSSLTPGTVVAGSGLVRLLDKLPTGVVVVPQPRWEPRAATVGRLAWLEYERGRRDDLWTLAPVYLRPSYAEEKISGQATRLPG